MELGLQHTGALRRNMVDYFMVQEGSLSLLTLIFRVVVVTDIPVQKWKKKGISLISHVDI